MRKKITTMYLLIVMAVVLAVGNKMTVKAEKQAVFRVQTAEALEDGTIKVSVYLTDTIQLGGVDAELTYDPAKVSCIDSGLGESFKDGYGETHCNESKSVIKCVAVYPEAKIAQGELMYAVFKLSEGESYQPELKVIDLVDASKEIQSIPYSITYQHADGEWAETQDLSGKRAEESIVKETRSLYEAGTNETDIIDDSSKPDKTNTTNEATDSEDKQKKETAGKSADNNKEAKSEKSGNNTIIVIFVLLVGGIVILLALIFTINRIRKRRGQNET